MKNSFRKAMSLCVSLIMLFSLLIPAGSVFASDAPKIALSIVDENGAVVSGLNRYDVAYLRVEVSGISSVTSVRVKIDNSDVNVAKFSTDFGEYKLRYQDTPAMKASNGADILNIDNTDGVFGGVSLANDSVTLTLANNMSSFVEGEEPPVTVSEFVMCDIPFEVVGSQDQVVNFAIDGTDSKIQLTSSVNSIYKVGAANNLIVQGTGFTVSRAKPVIEDIKFVDASEADLPGGHPAIKALVEKYADGGEFNMDWSDYKVKATVYAKDAELNVTNPELLGQRKYYTYYTLSSEGSTGFVVEGWKDRSEGAAVGMQTLTVKVIDGDKVCDADNIAFTKALQAEITAPDSAKIIKLKENTVVSVEMGTTEENAKKAVTDSTGLFVEVFKDDSTKPSAVKVTDLTITNYFSNAYGLYDLAGYTTDIDTVYSGLGYTLDSAAYKLQVKVEGTTSGDAVEPGTVVGGGGSAKPPKEEEPEEPVKPDEPVTPVEPVTPGVAPDVAADHWAAEAVKTLLDKGIVSGDTNGNIRPNDNITREEVAKIVAIAQGLTIEGDASNVTDSHLVSDWAKPYVSAVVKAGAFSGNTDGSFAPKVAITREQFAAVIIRAYGFGEGTDELKFTDAGELTWSKGLVAKAVELGIVTGYGDNTFRPGAQITRAEAFTMLTRAMNLKAALEEAAGIAPKAE